MVDPIYELHIHCIERTGILGVASHDRKLPCSKCDWGHLQSPDVVIEKMRTALLLAREKLRFYDGSYKGGPHIGVVNAAIDIALAESP